MIAAAARHPGADNGAGAHALREFRRGEMFRAARGFGLDKYRAQGADLFLEKRIEPLLAFRAQSAGALLDEGLRELRHAGGGCSGPRGEGEDMQISEAAFLDELERVLEHIVGLCREAGNDVGAENDVGSQLAHRLAK